MPVKAHDGRIVLELTSCGLEDSLDEMLDDLAGVQFRVLRDQGLDVHAGGVALEHTVSDEDQPVAWRKRQRLHLVFVLAEPER